MPLSTKQKQPALKNTSRVAPGEPSERSIFGRISSPRGCLGDGLQVRPATSRPCPTDGPRNPKGHVRKVAGAADGSLLSPAKLLALQMGHWNSSSMRNNGQRLWGLRNEI